MDARPTIVVTGAAGNLGLRLFPLAQDFALYAIDRVPPADPAAACDASRFESLDLGNESATDRLIQILRATRAEAVVHLAFVIDPMRTGILDVRRMWQINVAGTARVLEAVAEVNRTGGKIRKLIIPSSVSVYGPDLPPEVDEDCALQAHTLTYAVHKKEADEVIQTRAAQLGDCATYLLRPHIFVGSTMQNYLVGALRGSPTGTGRAAEWMRARRYRLPMLLPTGQEYLEKRFQFVHVDDVARLIVHLLGLPTETGGLWILNVAGRGEALTLARCAELASARVMRLPSRWLCRMVLKLLWKAGVSAVPPDALPYMCGSYTMSTKRLQEFLGSDYERVIRFTITEGLLDSFAAPDHMRAASAG